MEDMQEDNLVQDNYLFEIKKTFLFKTILENLTKKF
jgi:hypothetical protein